MKKERFYSFIPRETLRELVFGGETPAFLYFAPIVQKQIEALRRAAGPRVSILYAAKANPHPALLRFMASMGVGADVASMGELRAALNAGIDPARIEFSGPGKTHKEIFAAAATGVSSINAESLDELRLLSAIGNGTGGRPNTGLRINPDETARAGLAMAGATHFGIPASQLGEACALLRKRENDVRFSGIHIHRGSQILDWRTIADGFELGLKLARETGTLLGTPCPKINFGGGWGIDYFPGQAPLDLDNLSSHVGGLLDRPEYRGLAEAAELRIEPGRFAAAECGVYAVRVLYVKENAGRRFAVTDGGIHHHYTLAGGMGAVIRRNYEWDLLSSESVRQCGEYPLTVTGRLCTPLDVLLDNAPCAAEIQPGDAVLFFNSGAYGPTASPGGFLSHPAPAERWIE